MMRRITCLRRYGSEISRNSRAGTAKPSPDPACSTCIPSHTTGGQRSDHGSMPGGLEKSLRRLKLTPRATVIRAGNSSSCFSSWRFAGWQHQGRLSHASRQHHLSLLSKNFAAGSCGLVHQTCSCVLDVSERAYGNGGNPRSFRNSLCFPVAARIALSISTSPAFVSFKLISSSPTAVLL